MATQAYYGGDFWDCIATTSPGQTPATNPEKWNRVAIPRAAATYVAQAAYASLMATDGQNDKRGQEERLADKLLNESVRTMRRFEAHPGTLVVLTR